LSGEFETGFEKLVCDTRELKTGLANLNEVVRTGFVKLFDNTFKLRTETDRLRIDLDRSNSEIGLLRRAGVRLVDDTEYLRAALAKLNSVVEEGFGDAREMKTELGKAITHIVRLHTEFEDGKVGKSIASIEELQQAVHQLRANDEECVRITTRLYVAFRDLAGECKTLFDKQQMKAAQALERQIREQECLEESLNKNRGQFSVSFALSLGGKGK
jgi:uncharacterized protein YecE (DUF72 family)